MFESFPTVTPQLSPVVEFQNFPIYENLDALLGIISTAIREIVNASLGFVFKLHLERRRVGCRLGPNRTHDRSSDQESRKIEKMAPFTDQPAAAQLVVLGPMVTWN